MALQFPTASAGDRYSSGSSAIYEYNGTYWEVIQPESAVVLTATTASYAVSSSYVETSQPPTIYLSSKSSEASADIFIEVGETALAWFINRGSTFNGRPQYSHAPVYIIREASNKTLYTSNINAYNSARTGEYTVSGTLAIPMDGYGTSIRLNTATGALWLNSSYTAQGDRLMVQKSKNIIL